MPYEIKRVVDGYKVCKQSDMKTCFSKRGLPYDNALRQMRAIIISEKGLSIPASKRTPKKVSKKVSKKVTRKGSRKGSRKGGKNTSKKRSRSV
jgi:hypothetical protein